MWSVGRGRRLSVPFNSIHPKCKKFVLSGGKDRKQYIWWFCQNRHQLPAHLFCHFLPDWGGGGCLPLPVTLLPHIFGAFALKQGSPGPHSPDLCGSPWSCAPSSPLYLLGVFQKLEPHRLEVTQTPSHADDFTRWNIVNCNQNMPVKCLEYLDKCLTVG